MLKSLFTLASLMRFLSAAFLACDIRREGGSSLVILERNEGHPLYYQKGRGGYSLVTLEGDEGNHTTSCSFLRSFSLKISNRFTGSSVGLRYSSRVASSPL